MNITVRHVAPSDAARWTAMRHALWPDDPVQAHAEEIASFFGGERPPGAEPEAALVAEAGGELVGFAELSRRPLVEAAERWALSLGCREFASDTTVDNVDSTRAHHALGFEEVGLLRCFRKELRSDA
jgi:aminoglycoside 6'-N-acetyltransferase I